MTNKQAIEWLIAIKEKYIHGGDEGFDELRKEALDKAVKALEEERPQGEWLDAIYTNNGVGVGMCNQCGIHKIIDNFCPNCGADMRGKEE